MQVILSDHNCEGQAEMIFDSMRHKGFIPLVPIELLQFRQVGLDDSTNDLDVWQFCQERGYLLLTGNRTEDDGAKSLEFNINRYVQDDSLPVLTVGNLRRVDADPDYCWRCALDLMEIALDVDKVRGASRLYIPFLAVQR